MGDHYYRLPEGLLHYPAHMVQTYIILADFADRGIESPTLREMAEAHGPNIPVSTVARRTGEMEAARLIKRHPWKKGEGGRRVRYELLEPRPVKRKRSGRYKKIAV